MKAFLPEEIRISQVHLRTANLERALGFYTGVLGLDASRQSGQPAALSAGNGPALLVLTEDPNALAHPAGSTGLYHVALRYSDRRGLAHAYRRLVNSGYPIDGASDHEVSEAIYLSDPDGNGVELYADRPSTEWRWRNGQVVMTTRPLALEDLLKAALPEPKGVERSPQMQIGHLHLHVADLAQAERFYSEFLGLAVTQRSYPGALFLAAGGYHHHIAVNTWGGRTAPPPNSVGLVSYRIEVPVAEILYCLGHRAPLLGYETRTEPQKQGGQVVKIRDPNGAWLEVQASSITGSASVAADCAGSALDTRTTAHLQGEKV